MKLLSWYPRDRTRRAGKLNARWEDDIIKFPNKKQCTRMAQDRAEWERLKKAFAQSLGSTRICYEIILIILYTMSTSIKAFLIFRF